MVRRFARGGYAVAMLARTGERHVLNQNFQTNTMALLHLARRLAPAMIEAGEGAIIVTSNTSALRGKPRFAGFAPTKAAQRILAEAIAREVGPHLAKQHRSTWTHEIDLRAFSDRAWWNH
jgi:NAD(P)-dependent dehydrogenase (short-subunit alcohol dehydrogenase family)